MSKIILLSLFVINIHAKPLTMDKCLKIEDQHYTSTKNIMKYQYCEKNPNEKGCSKKQISILLENMRKSIEKSQSTQAEFQKCQKILYP